MQDFWSLTELTARYQPGKSALGHHWELFDAAEQPVGRTEREYSGGVGKRQLWRLVTATGMDGGNDVRARVLDAGGTELAGLFGRNVKPFPRVEVFTPDEQLVGVAHHPEDGLVRYVGAGEELLATLPIPDRKATPWSLLDAAGAPIGLVDREVAKPVAGPSLLDYAIGMNTITDDASDFAATMFRGFAFSNVYSVALAGLPPAGPLRTMAILTPLLLGHLY